MITRDNKAPLLLSAHEAEAVLGIGGGKFAEIAELLCLTPIPFGKRVLWSLPEIRHRLTYFDKTRLEKARAEKKAFDAMPLSEQASAYVDAGRTRAPRQSFMRRVLTKGAS